MQLTEQIKRAILVGAASPGDRLPTVKALAMDLSINPNTVARVYRDLEREGVIETAPRGSFVSRTHDAKARAELADEFLRERASELVREARAVGTNASTLRGLVEAAIARWYGDGR